MENTKVYGEIFQMIGWEGFALILLTGVLIGLLIAWLIWRNQLQRLEAIIDQKEKEISLQKASLKELEEKSALREGDLRRLNLQLTEAQEKVKPLQASNSKLSAETSVAKDHIEKLRVINTEQQNTIEDLQNQIIGLKTLNQKLGKQTQLNEDELEGMAQMQSSYNAAIKKVNDLESKIDKIEQPKKNAKPKAEKKPAAKPAKAEKKQEKIQRDDLTLINGIGPSTQKKLNELGIFRYEQISTWSDDNIETITTALGYFPGRILRDDWIGQAQAFVKNPPAQSSSSDAISTNPGDLKIIEGVGPKIEKLLHQSGIKNWAELARASENDLRKILEGAGPNYRIHDPSTWANQAKLAAEARWEELREYQKFLTGGRDMAE